MPDNSALFPQPPQQNQQGNSLLSNPGQAIGLMQGIQNLQIQRQQAPALVQQPAAALDAQRLQNNTTDLALRTATQRGYSQYFSSRVLGLGHRPNDTELQSIATDAARQFPDYPEIGATIYKNAMGAKDRVGFARGLQPQALTPSEYAQPTEGPVDPRLGTPTSMPLGERAPLGKISKAAPPGTAEQRQAEEADVAGFNARTNPLRKLVDLEEQLKANGTPIGPGSAGRNKMEAFISTWFPDLVGEATKNKVSLYDQFTKYSAQNAAALSQGLAPHTNEGLNTVVHGSPNTENVAAGDLAKVQLGIEAMRTANLANAHRKDQNGEYVVPLDKVAGEKSRVGLDMDYRAFMPRAPEEWADLAGKLKGDERKRFNRSLQYGIKSGVIQPPGQ